MYKITTLHRHRGGRDFGEHVLRLRPPRLWLDPTELRQPLRQEAVSYPPEETCRVVARYRHSGLFRLNRRVAVFDDGGGDEDR